MKMHPTTLLVFNAIADSLAADIPPTYREIAERCNMAHTGVIPHVHKLEALGWLERVDTPTRKYRLGPDSPRSINRTPN